MNKQILNAQVSRKIALEAISEIASAVKQTLGPGGNPIVLQDNGTTPDGKPKPPIITKDGVTVAESISFRDPAKDTFAKAIIEIARSTVNQVGDGTTTAIVIAEAIVKEGLKRIQEGENGIQLYEELKKIKDDVIKVLDSTSIPVKESDVINVATISANGDREAAKIVAEAIILAGEDGYVSLEDGFSRNTTLEHVEGTVYKQGWRSWGPHGALQVTNEARNTAELSKAAVLLYAGKLDSVHEFGDFMKRFMGVDENGHLTDIAPLFIVAHDFSDEVRNFIVQNKTQAKIPIAAIKSPFDGSPNARTEMLEDLAVMIGGSVAAKGILELEDVEDEHLGFCESIQVGPQETVVFAGGGSEEAIMSKVTELKERLDNSVYEFDKENLRLRIGKLTGGIAKVRVGGDSELEMHERKDRIEDALCASKVAIQEGIIEGGGYALLQIADKLCKGQGVAGAILAEALQAPAKQIITNVGQNPEVVLFRMEAENCGFDARTKKYVDLIKEGIVDPVKVTKSALENAVSIAGLLLTTGGAVVNDVESKDGQPNPLAALGF